MRKWTIISDEYRDMFAFPRETLQFYISSTVSDGRTEILFHKYYFGELIPLNNLNHLEISSLSFAHWFGEELNYLFAFFELSCVGTLDKRNGNKNMVQYMLFGASLRKYYDNDTVVDRQAQKSC